MTDIQVTRDFAVSPARLFAAITTRGDLLQWWGPQSSSVTEGQLDFTVPGPWYACLLTDEGNRFKMSGHVAHVEPPHSVGFTWGWHDPDTDKRGSESHVTLTVSQTPTGARLTVDHRDLTDADIGSRHQAGWLSSLRSLESHLSPPLSEKGD